VICSRQSSRYAAPFTTLASSRARLHVRLSRSQRPRRLRSRCSRASRTFAHPRLSHALVGSQLTRGAAMQRRRVPALVTRESLAGAGRVHGLPAGSGGTERSEYRTAVDAAEAGRHWSFPHNASSSNDQAPVRDARGTYRCSTVHPVAVLDRGKPVLSDTHGDAPEGVVVTPHLTT
jgi:hypothetical protein